MSDHIHLDVTGGIAGDMFLAAMLAAFPHMRQQMEDDLRAAGVWAQVTIAVEDVREMGFAATRVTVQTAGSAPPTSHWRDIRAFIENSRLRAAVSKRAVEIFAELAAAEATCHGVAPDDVHFHEIADWDSLADIIGAASLIEQAGAPRWSVSALPQGSGRVKTRHGLVPVPPPATAELLQGYSLFSDGVDGERITPTGAAILKYLSPSQGALGPVGTLGHSGTGAGHRQLQGIPNILRLLVFDAPAMSGDTVHLIRFEIDDMTPEEIAVALDRIRLEAGVLDASYTIGYGKKGRVQFSLSVICAPPMHDRVVETCFSETSTLGLRLETVARYRLNRRKDTISGLPVKSVDRPAGATAKVESDALARTKTLKARRALAAEAEHDHD
ncbi:LarC family nickel insertion protein [Roseobacter sp. YSTF-M11]|uniref:LarC family nickel insertion protein n=1 Tax=Roseobacter insulae TaxID=2859783 RepID=A0A9X1FTF7_9RHOB|nr:LarC family nickel insertion protein [Roseobacter insulae]MBW4707358.1 LarC family nickel insertion protein [Roseobacter insulae]